MTIRSALAALLALLILPAAAAAHGIDGVVHDERDTVLVQVPGTHASVTPEGTHVALRRDGASVVEVLDLQGAPALKLDERGAWARKGATILTVLDVETGAPDPGDARWLDAGGSLLRFHYPGTHGPVAHAWSVPLRVDGRAGAIRGAVRPVAKPPLVWVSAAIVAVAMGIALVLRFARGRRRVASVCVAGLALAVVAVSYGESQATGARAWGELVAALVGAAGLAAAWRLRRDAALEQGVLAVAAILLVLPLIGRLAVLRHGVIVTTLDPDLVRALVVGGLGLAAGTIAAAARAWWPAAPA